MTYVILMPECACTHYNHGTTEEGSCSYLLPRAAAAGSNGTNKGQIHKVPLDSQRHDGFPSAIIGRKTVHGALVGKFVFLTSHHSQLLL